MSGRKTFTAGEVLQAADVNDFLMDQSVMVFAGTAARGSAIPSPSEGMVTYLEDADEVQVYTTDWGAVGGGKIVDFKTVTKTDTFSASVTAGNSTAVTGLSLTHEVADAANKLLITAFFGIASGSDRHTVGIAVNDGSGFLSVGDAASNRTRVTAGQRIDTETAQSGNMSVTIVHTPGAGSFTYSVHAICISTGTQTLYINRNGNDSDAAFNPRGASALHIMEVAG